ncbi:hypothetical protein BD410DRAFT_734767, partial [Rickenella mellea]
LEAWKPHRDDYLAELLRLEGPGHHRSRSTCATCKANEPQFRCRECFDGGLTCSGCCVKSHTQNPLHVIEKWNGTFFEKITLKSMGLRVQLGHSGLSPCLSARAAPKDFTVIHTNGIHNVAVNFCGCSRSATSAGNAYQQLLRRRWFPATHLQPQTCCTLECLHLFHLLTLQSKISGYDFYQSLASLTDNVGTCPPPDRRRQFMRIVREYKHLTTMKRAGRGHAPGGVAATAPGELAVLCAACPHPGVNLPDNWQDQPPEKQFLYTLSLSMDANFRLKNKMVSTVTHDQPLADGMAYFVPSAPYKEHLLNYTNQEDISSCSGLAALALANTKYSKGYRATGVGNVVCRHQCVMRNGIGDLQKGERYVILELQRINVSSVTQVFISYDIACQWSVNFRKRWEELPDHLGDTASLIRGSGIGKFHEYGHGPKCRDKYSLNYLLGVGRLDGEGVERNWSWINPVAMSTKEMGFGSRQDTLDDHWGAWNFRKLKEMGPTLLRNITHAVPELRQQEAALKELEAVIDLKDLVEWKQMVSDWNADKSKPNPYRLPDSGMSTADIRLALAEEEADDVHISTAAVSGDMSAAGMVSLAIEIEELQYVLVLAQEKKNTIARKLSRLQEMQKIIVPAAAAHMEDAMDLDDSDPRKACLWLPSDFHTAAPQFVYPQHVVEIETRLRHGQCRDALEQLRTQLVVKTRLLIFKAKNVRAQRPNTRARTLIASRDTRIKLITARYRRARQALKSLIGDGDWEKEFRELRDDDVRGLHDPDFTVAGRKRTRSDDTGAPVLGRGYELLPWIWVSADAASAHEGLRVEWAKASARVERWSEEVSLLKEEMRRVLQFLEWRARWWDVRREFMREMSEDFAAGARAYAHEQAKILLDMRTSWITMWQKKNIHPQAEDAADEAEEVEGADIVFDDSEDQPLVEADDEQTEVDVGFTFIDDDEEEEEARELEWEAAFDDAENGDVFATMFA